MPPSLVGPIDLLLTSLVAAALVWLVIDLIEGRRLRAPGPRLLAAHARAARGRWSTSRWACSMRPSSGATAAFCNRLCLALPSTFLHFSLHPFDAMRLGLAFGLVLLHAAVSGAVAALIRAPALLWRMPRGAPGRRGGTLGRRRARGVRARRARRSADPVAAVRHRACRGGRLCAVAVDAAGAAPGACRSRCGLPGCFSRSSCPPSRCIRRSPPLRFRPRNGSSRTFGAQVDCAARRPSAACSARALDEIDALPALPQLVTAPSDEDLTSRAFGIWSQTELAEVPRDVRGRALRADGRR